MAASGYPLSSSQVSCRCLEGNIGRRLATESLLLILQLLGSSLDGDTETKLGLLLLLLNVSILFLMKEKLGHVQ